MAALEAGKHVMCEWSLGRDIGEAEKMAEAARTAGVRTCIGLQGRMALTAQRAREMLSTGGRFVYVWQMGINLTSRPIASLKTGP
jgi:predicted dehydrogenase